MKCGDWIDYGTEKLFKFWKVRVTVRVGVTAPAARREPST